MLRVLLTGATGFLGSQVLKHLSDKEVQIKIISRQQTQKKTNTKVYKVIHTKDLFNEDDEWMEQVCHDIDIIIHCAWYAEPGMYLKSNLNLDCKEGTIRLAKAAIKNSVKRFIGIGSCFEYDLSTMRDIETNTELKPLTPYANAKVQTFQALSELFLDKSSEFLWARMFYLYGEGEDPRRLIPTLRKNLREGKKVSLTEGSEVRDYLDICEAGEIVSNLSFSSLEGAFNVCSGTGITIREIALDIAEEYDSKHLLEFGTYEMNSFESKYIVGKKVKYN